jgi:methionyl aminopeptidase
LDSASIIIKTAEEIAKLRKSNIIVAEMLGTLREMVKPGITTMDLERKCEQELKKIKVIPAFKGYKGFPFCLCTSVNNVIVHGMPSKDVVLKEGDILSIDFGVLLDGFYGDSAITIGVGEVTEQAQKLMDVTSQCLERAIEATRIGNRLYDISYAVQSFAESEGFSVVKAFVGHGIGRSLHEPPQIPNFGDPDRGPRIKEGMVFAIEPMINVGDFEMKVLDDGWTAVTADNSLSAHFEHSIAVTQDGPFVLSRL